MPETKDGETLLTDYFLRFKDLWPKGGVVSDPPELSTGRLFSFGQGETAGEFQIDFLPLEKLEKDEYLNQIFTTKTIEDLRRLLGEGPHIHVTISYEDEEVWRKSGIPYGVDKPSVVEYILTPDGKALKYITRDIEKDQIEKLVPLEGGDIELMGYLLTTAKPKYIPRS